MPRSVEIAFRPAEARGTPELRVVIDILRATSTIVTALAAGAHRVVPVGAIAAALARRGPGVIVGGEREGRIVAGFDRGNSPREYRDGVAGKSIVLCTTNGTPAICGSGAMGGRTLIASLLNLGAVRRQLAAVPGDVLIICSGKEGGYSLEDAVAAGGVADGIEGAAGDGALMARALWRQHRSDLVGMLRGGNHGRSLLALGLDADLEYCAQTDLLDLVPELQPDGTITAGDRQ